MMGGMFFRLQQKEGISLTYLLKMSSLGKNQKILPRCIKTTDGENTYTKVKTLDKEEIIEEVARMLSGDLVSNEAEAAAKSLISASIEIS